MKPPSVRSAPRSIPAWLAHVALLCGAGTGCLLAGTVPIDLDSRSTPLVTAGDVSATTVLASVTGTAPEYEAFAREVEASFPPGNELFLALFGDPAFLGLAPGRFAGDSTAALGAMFCSEGGGGGGATHAVPGRVAAYFFAEEQTLSLGGEEYVPVGINYVSPLVLDLDGSGVFTPAGGAWLPHPGNVSPPFAVFDVDGDGFGDVTEWIRGRGFGFVTTTPDPRSGKDLLGSAGGWPDGFDRADGQDNDCNGFIEGPERDGLYVWEDEDGDTIAGAGEIRTLAEAGVLRIPTQHAPDFTALYEWDDPVSGPVLRMMWDFWPSYAIANRMPNPARPPKDPPEPRACRETEGGGMDCPRWLRMLGRVANGCETDAAPGQGGEPTELGEEILLTPERLRAAGVRTESFRLLAVARGGTLLVGSDLDGMPARPRLLVLHVMQHGRTHEPGSGHEGPAGGSTGGGFLRMTAWPLPMDEIAQVAMSPRGDRMLVFGDHGSKMIGLLAMGKVKWFEDGDEPPRRGGRREGIEEGWRLFPPGGIDLRPLGLRAMGEAGWSDGFWFTAWDLDGWGDVRGKACFRLLPGEGIREALDLEELEATFGPIRERAIVSPEEVYVVTETAGGGSELWRLAAGEEELCGEGEAFGGLAAAPGAVVFTTREGSTFRAFRWREEMAEPALLEEGPGEPLAYPFVSPDGRTAVVTRISAGDRAISYRKEKMETGALEELLAATPGQGKMCAGAFAHYGPEGIRVIPLAGRKEKEEAP